MRATPLAIFGCFLPATTLAAMAEQDACLSHPNKACQSCNAAYVAAVGHLISHPGDREGAIEVATAVALHPDFDPDVRAWLLEDSLDEPTSVDCVKMIGFCRWGFTLAFMFLRTGIRSGRRTLCISCSHRLPLAPFRMLHLLLATVHGLLLVSIPLPTQSMGICLACQVLSSPLTATLGIRPPEQS